MDRIDKKILTELQLDGRLSFTELAERVGLSLSPCHRRVRALEESGAIKGYKAILDPRIVGLGFSAIVFVTIKEGDKKAVEEFENAIVGIPEIVQAQRLFGEPDFLLHIVADDLPAYQRFYDEKLMDVPGVQRLISTIVMKNVVPERPLPFTL
jgi:DNA-binding Lrp family transcriptional regulator